MPVKRLSQPFPAAIFPEPDGLIDAADRAALMVGYPLVASAPAVPAPAPVAEEAAVVARVPSIRIAPMVYRDILQGWMEPWRGTCLESQRKQALKALMPHLQTSVYEKIRMMEKMPCKIQLLEATNRDIFKAKELLTGEGNLSVAMPDKLRFGLERRLLIDQMDRWLSV